MTNELKTASVLAFERKLDPSDALLFAGNWAARTESQDWAPITLR
ncbi:MAG: type I-F CRISPR-associated protein Cas7f/Csy3, partial [Rhodanobacter sp.]